MDFGMYGKTWWSKKWLQTLLSSADEKTIATGVRYASRGQVHSIDIIDNRVISVVKGPNGGLHNNYIVFPKFSKESSEIFQSILKQHPMEVVALKNKAMNQSIELLMLKSKLQLFDTLPEINSGCDCRDPLPCKYLVATFLKIAEQADEDPNVLFKIHGLDLIPLFENSKAEVESETAPIDLDVMQEANLVRTFGKPTKFPFGEVPTEGEDFRNKEERHEDLDRAEDASESFFGGFQGSGRNSEGTTPPKRLPTFEFDKWSDYSQILPAMLQNFPKFCPAGNFRKSYNDELQACRQFFRNYENFDVFSEHFRTYNAKTFLMENESIRVMHRNGWRWRFEQINGDKVIKDDLTAANIMGALCCLSAGNFSWHHYTVRYLHLLLTVAYHLVRTGAIYPQVFWIGRDTAQMRWLPAEMMPEILSMVTELETAAPRQFIWTEHEGEFSEITETAEHLLSLFIAQLLKFARTYKTPTKTNHGNLLSFFFDCISGKLANNAHTIPSKIQQWFSVYSSLDFQTKLLFACYETGDEVALEVFVLENDANEALPRRVNLSELFENNDTRLLSILSILNGVSSSFKPMEDYLAARAAIPILMHGTELLNFLQDCVKKLEIFGIQTEIPQSLLHIGKPKPKIRLQGSMSFGGFSASDLIDFDWEIAIGDENVSAKEFFAMAEEADGLLKYKSQYVQVTKEDLQEIRNKIEGKAEAKKSDSTKAKDIDISKDEEVLAEEAPPEITQTKLIQACFTGECSSIPVEMTGQFKQQFDAWRAETDIPLPENLNATLRPYQMRGYSWMYKNLQIGFGCILADDMGLGKTLQVITFLLKMKQEGKFEERKAIVIMPAGLLCNWQMEIKKFAPELSFFAYHGGRRDIQKFNADVLLTTYATFRKDFAEIDEREWQAIIIDEAQNIKNADSEQSKLLRKMKAPMKIAMSGTPVENRLMEFWSIMDFANRGFFPSAQEFREKYEVPIQKNNNQVVVETFRKITAPFMLRRLKTDKNIISDLPDKIIQDEYAELTKPQAALYQKTLERFMQQLEMEEALSEKANDAHALFKRKGIILQMILALKQICNHPATFLKRTGELVDERTACGLETRDERRDRTALGDLSLSAHDPRWGDDRVDALDERRKTIDDRGAAGNDEGLADFENHRSEILDDRVDALDERRKTIDDRGAAGNDEGFVDSENRSEMLDESDAAGNEHLSQKALQPTTYNLPPKTLTSGKLQMLLDLLKSIQEQGEKTLIFTQFAEMGKLLEASIESELGLHTHFYHGGCTQSQRSEMILDFQQNPDCKVLILSLKAGGTGLNLTAASQVIHYDLWWNPAIEAQATDRAFRIGQTKNVQVHRFITKGTFEEKINALLQSKRAIADMTVNAGETWLADMSDKELGEVFGLENTIF